MRSIEPQLAMRPRLLTPVRMAGGSYTDESAHTAFERTLGRLDGQHSLAEIASSEPTLSAGESAATVENRR